MKVTFGRKFWAGLVGLLLNNGIFLISLKTIPSAIDGKVMVTFAFFNITIVFMYIGGNVWNSWIKSKHFHPELLSGVGNTVTNLYDNYSGSTGE